MILSGGLCVSMRFMFPFPGTFEGFVAVRLVCKGRQLRVE